jgi:hypothetical protein
MTTWQKVSLWSLAIWIVGFGIGMGTGAIGVCSSGNLFGVTAFMCGLGAMVTFAASLLWGFIQFIFYVWDKYTDREAH